MEIKSHEFDAFAQGSARGHRIFVIYGPDHGLVSERATVLAEKTKVSLDDPFCFIRLDVSDLQSSPGRLVDEVDTLGLFGGEKLVWVRGASNEKALIDSLQAIAQSPPESSFLLIEAGDLKKTSALRKLAESARNIVTVPCYADDAKALNGLIDNELGAENLRITPAGRQMLLSLLGGDRIASRSEVRKLALYCRGLGTIDESHVVDIIGDASAVSADDAVDAVLKGDVSSLHHAMQKIASSKTPVFLVLQGCLRQFQLLDTMRAEMDEKRTQPAQVLQTLGRHLHFRRKPIVEQALRAWTAAAISREMGRLQAAILQCRLRPAIEDTIAMHTLLSIALQASRKTS